MDTGEYGIVEYHLLGEEKRRAESTIRLFPSPFCSSLHLFITEVIDDLYSLFCLDLLAIYRGFTYGSCIYQCQKSAIHHLVFYFSATLRQL